MQHAGQGKASAPLYTRETLCIICFKELALLSLHLPLVKVATNIGYQESVQWTPFMLNCAHCPHTSAGVKTLACWPEWQQHFRADKPQARSFLGLTNCSGKLVVVLISKPVSLH